MQPSFPDFVLSPEIHAALDRIGHRRGRGRDVRAVTEGLGALPLHLYDRVARELGWRFGRLGETRAKPAGFTFVAFWRRPADIPAWFRLFDYSGYVREAALKELKGPAPNAFFIAALAFRLNDWVPEVRATAIEALRRTSRYTDPAILAEALLFLLLRSRDWERWGDGTTPLDVLLDRPDVATILAAKAGASVIGPQAKILRQALRTPAMDIHLPELLHRARQPAVRALALRVLAEGRIEWDVGRPSVKQWIDKSMGHFRLVRRRMHRPVVSPFNLAELVQIGAGDKSAQVRLAAATMLSLNYADIPDGRALAERLAKDKSRAVSERAAFLLR